MRAATLPMALAMLFAAAPLTAQGPNPPPLAPGEVLAQVAGAGQVRSQPEVARFDVTLFANAANSAAARAACEASLRDLIAKLKAAGVPDSAISVPPGGGMTRIGFISSPAYDDDDDPSPATPALAMAAARQRKTGSILVHIELTDMSRLAAVRKLLSEREDAVAQPATLALRDDSAARRAAVAQAVAKARQEADAYSSALGLRVARIVRVFNPAATSEQPQAWTQMIAMMNGGGGTGQEGVTEARVGMDVVLAPR